MFLSRLSLAGMFSARYHPLRHQDCARRPVHRFGVPCLECVAKFMDPGYYVRQPDVR